MGEKVNQKNNWSSNTAPKQDSVFKLRRFTTNDKNDEEIQQSPDINFSKFALPTTPPFPNATVQLQKQNQEEKEPEEKPEIQYKPQDKLQQQQDESKPWYEHLADFSSGVYEGGKDTVTGLGSMAKGAWNLTAGWATNPEEAQSTWNNLSSTTQAIVDDPSLVWEGIKQPYVEAWEDGRPGEAIGRGTFEALSFLVGTKGVDKLSKGSKIAKAGQTLDKIGDTAKTVDKIADTGQVVDKISDAAKVTEQIGDLSKLSQIKQTVKLGKLIHTLKLKRFGNKIRLVLCSECGPILEKIDQVLPNISSKGSTKSLYHRLEKLRKRSIALEESINAKKVPFQQIPAEVNQIAAHLKDLSKKYPEFDFYPSFRALVDYDSFAKRLGFTRTNYKSHGQPVYRKGHDYITPDVDSHIGGTWKKADSVKNLNSKKTRMGTYDENLRRIGD